MDLSKEERSLYVKHARLMQLKRREFRFTEKPTISVTPETSALHNYSNSKFIAHRKKHQNVEN